MRESVVVLLILFFTSGCYLEFTLGGSPVAYDELHQSFCLEPHYHNVCNYPIGATEPEQRANLALVAGKAFAEKYNLPIATGIHISRTLQNWARIENSGFRVPDVDDFVQRLYGVSRSRVEAALKLPNSPRKAYELRQINRQVAEYWGTTPAISRRILKHWYQLSTVNIL